MGDLDIAIVNKILLQELLDSLGNLLVGKQPAVKCPGMSTGPEPLPAACALVVPTAAGNLQETQNMLGFIALADESGRFLWFMQGMTDNFYYIFHLGPPPNKFDGLVCYEPR